MDQMNLLRGIEQLPAYKRMEAQDFIEFLASQEDTKRAQAPMSFSWAGGLSDLKDEYSSRALKKQAVEWMTADSD